MVYPKQWCGENSSFLYYFICDIPNTYIIVILTTNTISHVLQDMLQRYKDVFVNFDYVYCKLTD